MKLTNWFKKEL